MLHSALLTSALAGARVSAQHDFQSTRSSTTIAPPTDEFKQIQAGGFSGLAAGSGRNGGASLIAFAGRSQEHAGPQPDHRSGVRGGLVVYRGVDRDAAVSMCCVRLGLHPQARYIVYLLDGED